MGKSNSTQELASGFVRLATHRVHVVAVDSQVVPESAEHTSTSGARIHAEHCPR